MTDLAKRLSGRPFVFFTHGFFMIEALCNVSRDRGPFRIGNGSAVRLLYLLTFGIQWKVIGPERLV